MWKGEGSQVGLRKRMNWQVSPMASSNPKGSCGPKSIRVVPQWVEMAGTLYSCLYPSLGTSCPREGVTLGKVASCSWGWPRRAEAEGSGLTALPAAWQVLPWKGTWGPSISVSTTMSPVVPAIQMWTLKINMILLYTWEIEIPEYRGNICLTGSFWPIPHITIGFFKLVHSVIFL